MSRKARTPIVYVRHEDDASLIAAAIAAGRLTVLRPGHACGLSQTEEQFGTYTPTLGMREAIERQAASDFARRKRRAA